MFRVDRGETGMDKIGCLVIHGLGGNPDEVEPLVSRLNQAGFRVMIPRLKGHTGNRQDFKNVKYTDWINSAETGLRDLQSCCERVYLIGFSMGGLIAVDLGLRFSVYGIVTINTPIYYWNIKQVTANLISDIQKRDFVTVRRYLKSSDRLPVSALLNFLTLLKKTKSKLSGIKCPILITQAINDDAVRKISADYIYGHVLSEVKRLKYYDCQHHLILWSPEADAVIHDIIEFLREIEIEACEIQSLF
jgi:carboxylesterase